MTQVGRIPAVAFEPLGRGELERFVELTPPVFEALKGSGFDIGKLDPDVVLADLAGFVDRIGAAEGVAAVLDSAGADWPTYRRSLLQVTAAAGALVEEMFGDLVYALLGSEGPDPDTAENEGDEHEPPTLAELVPGDNIRLLLEYEDALETLEDLLE